MISQTFYHLRSCIARTSTCSFEHLSFSVQVSKAEIDELHVVIMIEEDIFRLQIPMHDANPVDIFDA